MKDKNVDVVIYWVDGSDPDWRHEYKKHKKMNAGRFRDLGTLKYVFRGIEKFMPWVRNVHFITNGQKPEWLDISKVKFHTHEDIFYYKDALPVFNSSAIEANFSNIPDLAQKFILFNDDMLVLKPVDESRFFVNDLPVDYIKLSYRRGGGVYNFLRPQNNLAISFINNAYTYLPHLNVSKLAKRSLYSARYNFSTKVSNLIYSKLSNLKWFEVYHHPQPHLLSTWSEFAQRNLNGIIKTTCFSKFRSKSDINQYLYRYLNLINERFYPAEFGDHLSVYVKKPVDVYKALNSNIDKLSFFCICEDELMSDEDFDVLKNTLISYLDDVLGGKSVFEK